MSVIAALRLLGGPKADFLFDFELSAPGSGSSRLTSDVRLSELPPPNQPFKRECLCVLYDDNFVDLT